MYAIYKTRIEDLDETFLDSLRKMFRGKEIEIVVSESAEVEDDETAYLLRSPASRERLLKAMENVANGRDLVTVDVGEMQ
jgi:PHD/YefM family antitoxin component YafN of YafNO toxin-antitoxin module